MTESPVSVAPDSLAQSIILPLPFIRVSFIQTLLPLGDRQATGHAGKPRLRGVQGKVYNLCVTRLGSECSSPAGSFMNSLICGRRSRLTSTETKDMRLVWSHEGLCYEELKDDQPSRQLACDTLGYDFA